GSSPAEHWLFDNWFSVGPPNAEVTEADGRVHALAGDSLNLNDALIAGVREMVGRADFRFPFGSALKGPLVGSSVDEIWKDDYGVVAIRVHYGEGTIIALADTYWLSNKGIDEADNSFFLANL